MEKPFHSFKKEIAMLQNARTKNSSVGAIIDYEEALEIVREKLGEKLENLLSISGDQNKNNSRVQTKEDLRVKLAEYKVLIADIVFGLGITIRGFEGTKIHDFVDEMVHEFAGYSILSDAFDDPSISDIYVLDWNRIFVEKDGVDTPYWRSFNDAEHFENVLDRFLRVAGKELNDGEQKILDFELYGDRGCATAVSVSPRGHSLTLRKHAEDQIQRDDLIRQDVMTEDIADMLGNIIMGESNVIYAGITGSGKTTSIRALLDYYVAKVNKRMLVCEDTQELFPKNEHTLELVSYKSENPLLEVPLSDLIITALRLKPKYIVVGEVRGEEATAAVEGMETGHSTIFTMHGGTAWNCINRLVTKYMQGMPSLGIDVVERIIGSSVDYICIQDDIPNIGRRVSTIDEISYNFDTRRVELKPIVRFDIRKNEFVMKNKLSFEKAENMMRRGIQWDDIKQWVEEPATEKPA